MWRCPVGGQDCQLSTKKGAPGLTEHPRCMMATPSALYVVNVEQEAAQVHRHRVRRQQEPAWPTPRGRMSQHLLDQLY